MPVIVDDRALNQRAIQMLGAILAQQDGDHPTATPPSPGGGSVLVESRRPRRIASQGRRRRGSQAAKGHNPMKGEA